MVSCPVSRHRRCRRPEVTPSSALRMSELVVPMTQAMCIPFPGRGFPRRLDGWRAQPCCRSELGSGGDCPPLSLLREGPGGFASRVHTWRERHVRELCRPEKWCIAPGHDASQHKMLCAGEATAASSRSRSHEAIASNYAGALLHRVLRGGTSVLGLRSSNDVLAHRLRPRHVGASEPSGHLRQRAFQNAQVRLCSEISLASV